MGATKMSRRPPTSKVAKKQAATDAESRRVRASSRRASLTKEGKRPKRDSAPRPKGIAARKRPSHAKTSPSNRRIEEKLDSVREVLDELLDLIRGLAVRGGGRVVSNSPQTSASPDAIFETAKFDERLRVAVRKLDIQSRRGGLVPISDVRGALSTFAKSRAAFDEALLDAERRFVIDLKVSNDPRLVRDAELCIDDPGRGLLEYVVLR